MAAGEVTIAECLFTRPAHFCKWNTNVLLEKENKYLTLLHFQFLQKQTGRIWRIKEEREPAVILPYVHLFA